MSLANQTCWVVGGVGVVGRGITRGLLQSGATVIVNSRSADRLETLKQSLDNPKQLVTIHGSLLPGQASETVRKALDDGNKSLNHVVSHGAVRWWARPTMGAFENMYEYRPGVCDETYSLNIRPQDTLLGMTVHDFMSSSAQLAALHFSAAQQLVPRLLESAKTTPSTFTFVTGDGAGKPGGDRTAMGEINSHHVWGLSAALRHELEGKENMLCREIRVGLPVAENDLTENKRPLSEDIGDLCAGLAATPRAADAGRLFALNNFQEMGALMEEYNITVDESVGDLPRYLCNK
jgi:NAD(P)-dependent dehydrogenase (short-subunit alcohol dehydrogenase family)